MESSIKLVDDTNSIGGIGVYHRSVATLSPRVQWGVYRATLIISDVSLIFLALLLAAWTRFNIPLSIFNLGSRPTIPPFYVIAFGFVPLWLFVFTIHGLYLEQTLLGGTREYSGVFRAIAVGMLVIVIFGFLQPDSDPARGWVLLAWMYATALVIVGRFVLRRVVYGLRRRGYFLSPALIIGNNAEGYSLAEQLLVWETSGLAVQGFISTELIEDKIAPGTLPVMGTIDQLEELVRQHQIGELILATSALTQEQILAIFKRYGVSRDVNLRLSSGLFEVITTGLEVKEMASVPLLRINQVRLTGADRTLKTALDIFLAVGFLALTMPLQIAIAIAIKLDSPGNVFYRRRVMGLNGTVFDAYKFRTMHANGDAIIEAHPELKSELEMSRKLKDDPRVTRVGRFLRKHSLDELPQFLNVLMRQMSVVGPRMITQDELAMYEQWDINLLTVPPGITGLWQVSGRSDISYRDRVQLDMRYIRNWSIWLDLYILMRTTVVVIKGKGAY